MCTMDEMKDGASSWAHEIKTYELEKRRVLDEGFLRPPAMKLTAGQMKSQERVFDPLLQRYRDNETEYKQRLGEEKERVNHLNRAMDVQVLREQPHHILTHESRFDAIAPGQDPVRQPHKPRQSVGKGTFPDSQQDYNIISNMAFDSHHWNRPDARPNGIERTGQQRKIHASRVRDFNIVNNRYPKDHEARTGKEKELSIMEAAHKFTSLRKFDPVVQQYNDPKEEENAKHCDDARDVEVHLRAVDKIPPSYKGRHTEFYDPVSNEVHNPEMVKYLGEMEAERKDRYRNRYIVEHNFHAQDIKGDHMTQARKLNKVHPDRFMEHDRGYCMITNKGYGNGPKEQVHFKSNYAQPRMTPWEEIEQSHFINGTGRSASTPALPSAAAAEAQRSGQPATSSEPGPRRSSRDRGGDAGSVRSRRSQRSETSQRSQTLSEAGGRAVSISSSNAQLRDPPGATRAILQAAPVGTPLQGREAAPVATPLRGSASTPNLGAATQLAPVPEFSASAVKTRKLPSPAPQARTPAPLGESLQMTRGAPPPAPVIPGSPMGSVYSRPSAKF